MFEIRNVSKKYNLEYAIKNLNLEIGIGLNYIVGASGSGKTTLLKIISGMDSDFEGDVLYLGNSIKKLTDNQKAFFYNNKFGFIWQDFNLIEEMTVEENILLSIYIKNSNSKSEVEKVLRKLKITNLRNKKVKLLSGGQKQRVAIARELVKKPEVIIADEPTSALDSKTSAEVMKILKEISKETAVIIVTHDTSLIEENSKVYELDKGELISKPQNINKKDIKNKTYTPGKFKLSKALKLGIINNKSKLSRSIVTCLSIIVSTVLLITSLGGSISKSSDESFEKLFKEYGNSILDINIVSSFTSAGDTSDDKDEKKPKSDVDQDTGGLYEKYINDDRVKHLVFSKSFDNIKIKVNGKEYSIQGSNTAPNINELVSGSFPKNKGEVVVPESFVKNMGIKNEEALGKEIDFKGSVYNWDEGEPQQKEVNVKVKIVGVADTKLKNVYNGETYEFELEDGFFFDKETLKEVNKQAGIKKSNLNFILRTKDPKSLIEIKNEINSKGIVPLGQFELVEDMVNLDDQTKSLSNSSTIVISSLATLGLLAISLVTSFMRKREYAIYKVCGYSKSQLSLITFAESIILEVVSLLLIAVLSPAINALTKCTFGLSVLNIKILLLGALISSILSFIVYIISSKIAKESNPLKVLQSGGR